MKKLLKKVFHALGYEVTKTQPKDFGEYREFSDIYAEYAAYSMTGIEPMYALYKAVEYIVKNNIPGNFAECGVWRGGSSMLIAKTLLKFHCNDRHIYLFDTFEGMSPPTEADIDMRGSTANELLSKSKREDQQSVWCYAGLAEVESNMKATGYPANNIHFIKGKVEDTLPKFTPGNKLALLRLDTDWYESTKAEMNYLFPLLQSGGVLIVDDYGHWQGAKKAVDEYISENKISLLLNRIDYTVRIAVKQ